MRHLESVARRSSKGKEEKERKSADVDSTAEKHDCWLGYLARIH